MDGIECQVVKTRNSKKFNLPVHALEVLVVKNVHVLIQAQPNSVCLISGLSHFHGESQMLHGGTENIKSHLQSV